MGNRRIVGIMAVCSLLALVGIPATASAQQSSSNNYQVNEVYFGPGGNLNASSPNYQGQQSVENEAGKSTSNNYQSQAGFNTTDQPVLEVTVNGGVFDMGILSTSTVRNTSASFSVRNYLSSGYIVQIAGTALRLPANRYTLPAMSTPAASSPGTEQFGVNLRLNTNPPGVGADPQQQPDSTFSYGTPTADYNTPNQFKFLSGDTIASSTKSSGKTLYTLSAIANIATSTPAGQYGTNLDIIVTPTF